MYLSIYMYACLVYTAIYLIKKLFNRQEKVTAVNNIDSPIEITLYHDSTFIRTILLNLYVCPSTSK